MPSKIPIERVGTIREGEIYLKVEEDHRATAPFDTKHQKLNFIVVPKHDVKAEEYDWFKIIRAWEQNEVVE